MFNTLKTRFLTAIILVPLVLIFILYAHPLGLAVLACGVLAIGAWEWLALIPITNQLHQLLYGGIVALSLWLCSYWLSTWVMVSLGIWLLMIAAVLTYPRSETVWGRPVIVALSGILLLPLAGCILAAMYQLPYGKGLIIYVLMLVAAADSGAYFAGNLWGKHPLIPNVSSGKTIEGSLGGFVLPMLVAWVGALLWSPDSKLAWFGLALVTTVVSMFGDLFISMLKRRSHVKDTGSLLPGHGGVLDRIDSLLAALPWFYVGLLVLPLGL